MCGVRSLVLFVIGMHLASAQDVQMLKKLKECLARDGSIVCLKERALDILNETITSDKPISIYGAVELVKDPEFVPNNTEKFLPRDITQRSLALNDILYDKVEEFFESRAVKVNLGDVFEGRKKNKRGGMLMLGGMAMAALMSQLFMGKIAMMAGAALLVSKLALLLSAIIGLKKLGSSGGGESSSHVVIADGHGGWHRSAADENKNNPYRGYTQNEVTDNYAY